MSDVARARQGSSDSKACAVRHRGGHYASEERRASAIWRTFWIMFSGRLSSGRVSSGRLSSGGEGGGGDELEACAGAVEGGERALVLAPGLDGGGERERRPAVE